MLNLHQQGTTEGVHIVRDQMYEKVTTEVLYLLLKQTD